MCILQMICHALLAIQVSKDAEETKVTIQTGLNKKKDIIVL